jgi:hypothetical protein
MDVHESSLYPPGGALTIGSLWHDVAGRALGDELLEWAPDLFAFTDVVLDRSEAHRFAEVIAASPDQLNTILDDARAGAPWRRQLGVAEPSADLTSALEDLAGMVVSDTPTVEALLAAMDERSRRGDHAHLVRAVLGVKRRWREPPG